MTTTTKVCRGASDLICTSPRAIWECRFGSLLNFHKPQFPRLQSGHKI